MGFLNSLIAALPTIATSWQAVVGYVAVIAAFVVVSLKVTRNRNVLSKLRSLPEKDRARVLQMEMGAAYLATGLSPEQWLRQQRQRYFFVAFLAVCLLVVAMFVPALVSEGGPDPSRARLQAEALAKSFLSKLESGDMDAAYEMFPDEVRTNIGFAQFKADMERLFFQFPGRPLKDTVEQSIENGAMLSVMVSSEFAVGTKVRHVVGFAKGVGGWKLWQYIWQPVDWPLIWPTSTTTRSSAADVMKAFRSLNRSERTEPLPTALEGNITGSSPGWTLAVTSTSKEQDEHRCTVRTTEVGSQVVVELKHVVGGCKLSAGRRILAHAVLSAVSDARIELDAVRFFPAN